MPISGEGAIPPKFTALLAWWWLYSIVSLFSGDDHSEEDVEFRDPDAKKLNKGKVDSTSVCAGKEVNGSKYLVIRGDRGSQ